MELEFDDAKNRRNLRQRGLGFERARELLEGNPIVVEDSRREYSEQRLIAYGMIEDRLHVCVFTMRGRVFRIISLRRANRREIDAHRKNDF